MTGHKLRLRSLGRTRLRQVPVRKYGVRVLQAGRALTDAAG